MNYRWRQYSLRKTAQQKNMFSSNTRALALRWECTTLMKASEISPIRRSKWHYKRAGPCICQPKTQFSRNTTAGLRISSRRFTKSTFLLKPTIGRDCKILNKWRDCVFFFLLKQSCIFQNTLQTYSDVVKIFIQASYLK